VPQVRGRKRNKGVAGEDQHRSIETGVAGGLEQCAEGPPEENLLLDS